MEEQKRQLGWGYAVIAVGVIAGLLLTAGGGVLLGWLIIGHGSLSSNLARSLRPPGQA